MSSVDTKYLKDESGNTVSPVTAFESVYNRNNVDLGSSQAYGHFYLGSNVNISGNATTRMSINTTYKAKNITLNTSINRISVIYPGTYLISAAIHFTSNTTRRRAFANLLVHGNGSDFSSSDVQYFTKNYRTWDGGSNTQTVGDPTILSSFIINMKAGAYVGLEIYSSIGETVKGGKEATYIIMNKINNM